MFIVEVRKISKDKQRIPLYVLNNFIKFERTLYSFFGYSIGRPIKLKTLGYFLIVGLIELIIYFTPYVNVLIRWMPFAILLMIPIGIAWLLTDIGTEGRLPIKFFNSFFKYHFRKLKGGFVYRNKRIPKLKTYSFNSFVSYAEPELAFDVGMMSETMEGGGSMEGKNETGFSSNKEETKNHINKEEKSYQDNDLIGYLYDDSNDEKAKEDAEEVIEKVTKDVKSSKSDDAQVDVVQPKEGKKEAPKKKRKVKKKSKMPIAIGALVLVLVFASGILLAFINNNADNKNPTENNPIAEDVSDDSELNLLNGIKASSRQNHEEASAYFDNVDFDKLEKEDKEIVLLSYLYTDQVEKIMDLAPEFDEVIVSYYTAKDNLNYIRPFIDLSDEFKFALATEDDDYETIISLVEMVKLDQDKVKQIVVAYISLDMYDEALDFATVNGEIEIANQVKNLIKENEKSESVENEEENNNNEEEKENENE